MKKPSSLYWPGKQQSDVGILLIHGFTGTTNEMRPLGDHLNSTGWTVHAPLLKGHGVTPEQMNVTGWLDWYASVEIGYDKLVQEGCQHILVVGLSMGGLLALKLAQHHRVLGIVTMSTPVAVRDRRMFLAKYIQSLYPYKKTSGPKAEHIERHLYSYDRTPMACIASLQHLMENVTLSLERIHQPILIMQSGQDETVLPVSADRIYEQVGSEDRQVRLFPASSHVLTLDVEQEELHDEVEAFYKRLLATERVEKLS